jgi:FHA domain
MPSCPVGHESAADDYCDQCGRRMGGAPETSSVPGGSAARGGPASPGLAASASSNGQASGGTANGSAAPGEPAAQPCPECGTPRSGRFCEVCRFDFVSGTPTAPHPGPEPQAATPAGGPASAPPPASPQGPATTGSETTGGETAAPPAAPTGPAAAAAWQAVVTADRDYFERVVAIGGPEAGAISFPPYCPERRFSLGTARAGEEKQIGRHSASRGIDPAIDLTGPPTDPGVSRLHAVLIGQADGSWAVLDPGSENGTFVNDEEITVGVQVPLHDGDRIHLGAWTAITIRQG